MFIRSMPIEKTWYTWNALDMCGEQYTLREVWYHVSWAIRRSTEISCRLGDFESLPFFFLIFHFYWTERKWTEHLSDQNSFNFFLLFMDSRFWNIQFKNDIIFHFEVFSIRIQIEMKKMGGKELEFQWFVQKMNANECNMKRNYRHTFPLVLVFQLNWFTRPEIFYHFVNGLRRVQEEHIYIIPHSHGFLSYWSEMSFARTYNFIVHRLLFFKNHRLLFTFRFSPHFLFVSICISHSKPDNWHEIPNPYLVATKNFQSKRN